MMSNKNSDNQIQASDTVEVSLPENLLPYLNILAIIVAALMISLSVIFSVNRVVKILDGKEVLGATNDNDTIDNDSGDTTDSGTSTPNYEAIYTYAEGLGVNKSDLMTCVENETYADNIKSDISEGTKAGVSGTPGFVIGTVNGDTVTGLLIPGAYDYATFEAALNFFLSGIESELLAGFETVTTTIGDSPKTGNTSASVALVEYSDFECPYCSKHALNAGAGIYTNFVATNKIMWVYRDYPLSFHDPVATKEALIAECARKISGKDEVFFDMHDYIFENTQGNGLGL